MDKGRQKGLSKTFCHKIIHDAFTVAATFLLKHPRSAGVIHPTKDDYLFPADYHFPS